MWLSLESRTIWIEGSGKQRTNEQSSRAKQSQSRFRARRGEKRGKKREKGVVARDYAITIIADRRVVWRGNVGPYYCTRCTCRGEWLDPVAEPHDYNNPIDQSAAGEWIDPFERSKHFLCHRAHAVLPTY